MLTKAAEAGFYKPSALEIKGSGQECRLDTLLLLQFSGSL
jgi:hypothetical protein